VAGSTTTRIRRPEWVSGLAAGVCEAEWIKVFMVRSEGVFWLSTLMTAAFIAFIFA